MKKPFRVGPVDATTGEDVPKRIALLLWGPAACGKTSFAATAPGTKLWLSLGDQEHVSVSHRKDVVVANLSEVGYDELFKHAQSDDPFGLDTILYEHEEIQTVVLDSLTALAFRALQRAVAMGLGRSKKDNFVPSIETPGLSAYGGRNAMVLATLTGLLRITAKYGVHLIVTAHEDDPERNADGTVLYFTIMLGGKLVNNNTHRLSEIWYMSQEETAKGRRRIAVRPTRLRKPMKTRMFSGKDAPEFELTYDADKPDKGQMTIASFFEKWTKGGGAKIPVPK
jgi:hypothetical protein